MWNLKIQCTMTGGSTSQWLPSGGPAMYTENMAVPLLSASWWLQVQFRCDLVSVPYPLNSLLKWKHRRRRVWSSWYRMSS